jgi:hypothetical protein
LLTIVGAGFAASLDFGDVGAALGAASGFVGGMLIIRLFAWAPRMSVRQEKGLFNKGETP